ncbi:HD domain-containing protein [Shigella flexneri]
MTHPVAVACILAEMKLDYETLMAALLHDVMQDTPPPTRIWTAFWSKRHRAGKGVSKPDKLKFRDKKRRRPKTFAR